MQHEARRLRAKRWQAENQEGMQAGGASACGHKT